MTESSCSTIIPLWITQIVCCSVSLCCDVIPEVSLEQLFLLLYCHLLLSTAVKCQIKWTYILPHAESQGGRALKVDVFQNLKMHVYTLRALK